MSSAVPGAVDCTVVLPSLNRASLSSLRSQWRYHRRIPFSSSFCSSFFEIYCDFVSFSISTSCAFPPNLRPWIDSFSLPPHWDVLWYAAIQSSSRLHRVHSAVAVCFQWGAAVLVVLVVVLFSLLVVGVFVVNKFVRFVLVPSLLSVFWDEVFWRLRSSFLGVSMSVQTAWHHRQSASPLCSASHLRRVQSPVVSPSSCLSHHGIS